MTVGNPLPNQEHLLLKHLLGEGSRTEKQLEQALGDVDQIDSAAIAAWAENAAERGLIEPTLGSGSAVRRWNITDAGRVRIGVPTAR